MTWLIISFVFLVFLLIFQVIIWFRQHPPFVRGVAKAMAERYPFTAWDILLAYDHLGDWAEVTRLCEYCLANKRSALRSSIQDFQKTNSPGH